MASNSSISNLMSGFIGTILGAIIGVVATFLGPYFNYTIDFVIDSRAAVIELNAVKSISSSYINDKEDKLPKFKLLNMDINWKKVLLDVGDNDLEQLYFDIKKLDTLRELILQTNDANLKTELIKEYRGILKDLNSSGRLDIIIQNLIDKSRNRISKKSNEIIR